MREQHEDRSSDRRARVIAVAFAVTAFAAVAALGGGAVLAGPDKPAAKPRKPGKPAAKPRKPAARPTAEAIARARQDFRVVAQVLQSPRCMNCHPIGDRPLQTDRGRPHRMNISRRSPEVGLACSACHRERNARVPGAPPGAPHWAMPSREVPMVFESRTVTALCEQLKDPAQTGGRDLAALAHHVEHDALVLWGWDPGPGRTKPPVSHATFVAKFKSWANAGGPCPAARAEP